MKTKAILVAILMKFVFFVLALGQTPSSSPARNRLVNASLESIDDEALFAEAHRRERLKGSEKKGE